MGLVRPGEYNGTQGLECGLKIRRRPGPARTAFEHGVADNDAMIVLDAETNLIGRMPGGVNHVHKVPADGNTITVFEKSIRSDIAVCFDNPPVRHNRHLQPPPHCFQRLDMVGVTMGNQNGHRPAIT